MGPFRKASNGYEEIKKSASCNREMRRPLAKEQYDYKFQGAKLEKRTTKFAKGFEDDDDATDGDDEEDESDRSNNESQESEDALDRDDDFD